MLQKKCSYTNLNLYENTTASKKTRDKILSQ